MGLHKMRLTKRQLKRIIREEYSRLKIRGLIRESIDLGQQYGPDIYQRDLDQLAGLLDLSEAQFQTYLAGEYQERMIDFRLNYDEMADDFLFSMDLDEGPASAQELMAILKDPETYQQPMGAKWANAILEFR